MKNNLLLTTALVSVAFAFTASTQAQAKDQTHRNAALFYENNELKQNEKSKSLVHYKQIGDRLEIQAKSWANDSYGAYTNLENHDVAITIDNSTFKNNTSNDAAGALSLWHDGNKVEAKENKVLNSRFYNNSAKRGGAVALFPDHSPIEGKEGKTLFDNDQFIKNLATGNGGAMYIDHDDTTIKNSLFKENKAGGRGGAIYVAKKDNNGTLTIDNTVFKKNHATGMGGAILNLVGANSSSDNSKGVVITNSLFEGNSSDKQGGAIMNSGTSSALGDLDITNTDFVNNTSLYGGGGAIYSSGDVKIKGGLFKGNISHSSNGGAIFAAAGGATNHRLDIDGAVFDGNQAISTSEGMKTGFGGAISTGAVTTIKDSTFVNNFATNGSGALNVAAAGKLTFSGANVFKNNTTLSGKNDIDIGESTTVTLADGASLSLDGGISGEGGTLTLSKGSTLTVKDTTEVESKVQGAGFGENALASVHVVVTGDTMEDNELILQGENGIFTQTGTVSSASLSKDGEKNYTGSLRAMFDKEANNLYTFEEKKTSDSNGVTYTVKERSTGDIANRLGVKEAEAATLLATSSSKTGSGNEAFDDIQDTLRPAAQYGNDSATLSRAADALVADAAPVVQTRETMLANMIFDAASDALDDNASALVVGQASGDSLVEKAKIWIKGLFNSADKDETSKARGFDIDTYGVAMGADKEIGAGKVGLGYAYSQSDINGYTRDTDVDTHSVFLYGQYKPADWYVKGVAAYSWSDYEEKKSVLNHDAKAKYDVNTWALEGLYGYDFHLDSGYDITPEGGLRYLHASQDSYTNGLGVRVKDRDIDVWTAVAGVKVAKDFAVSDSVTIRPELRAALTYDLNTDDNDSSVLLPNGRAVKVEGEKLERFGYELGAKLATDITSNWEVSAGYEGRFREDYSDHTGILSAKYKF